MLRSSLTLMVIASIWWIWEAAQSSQAEIPRGLFIGAVIGAGMSLIWMRFDRPTCD